MTKNEFDKLLERYGTEKPKRTNAHKEDELQEKCIRWFEMQHYKYRQLLHHSPNGGWRQQSTAARFKRMGTRAGRPDLELNIARNGYHGLFIELKTDKGRLSEAQKEYLNLLEEQGYLCYTIRGVADFAKVVNDYLNENPKQ